MNLKLFLQKSTYQNIQAEQKEGYSCNAWYYKKWRIPIYLFDKNYTQDNVICHILHEEMDLDQS